MLAGQQALCAVCGRPLEMPLEPSDSDLARANTGVLLKPVDGDSNTQRDLPSRPSLFGDLTNDDEDIDISALLEGTSASVLPRGSADPENSGWRIRTARGVIYQMHTRDEVVQWFQSQSDLSAVTVSHAGGPFESAVDFSITNQDDFARASTLSIGSSEVAVETGSISDLLVDMDPNALLSTAQSPTQDAQSNSLLELDYGRASARHSHPTGGQSARSGSTNATAAQELDDGVTYGFRVASLVLIFAVLGSQLALGNFTETSSAPPILATTQESSTMSPELRRALDLLTANKYTAAARLLQRLSKTSGDPRVFLYLASALHQSDRGREAEQALARYRELMAQREQR